ncbi:MAG: hypothetical protein MK198_03585 [Gracilimonas sp.]|nr:hypothetical protein [Gracilimonas sp.]
MYQGVGIWMIAFLFLTLGGYKTAQAQGCQETTCAHFSSRSQPLTNEQAVLTNAVFSSQLGTPVNTTVTELQALFGSDLNKDLLLEQLRRLTGSATNQDLAAQSITLSQLLSAAETVSGDPAVVQAIQSLNNQIGSSTGAFVVGDFLDVGAVPKAGSRETINALDLVAGAISHASYNDTQQSTPLAATVSGSDIGLNGIVNTIGIYSIVTEPATYVCGPAGSRFYAASTRIKMEVDLVDTDKSSELQAAISNSGLVLPEASNPTLTLGQLELYFDVGRAEGVIQTIDALANTVIIQATPAPADMYLGHIDDAIFFSNAPIDPLTDLGFANVGELQVDISGTLVKSNVQVRSYSKDVQNPATETLTFTGPYPETRTVGNSAGYSNSLIQSLVQNTSFEVQFEVYEPQPVSPLLQPTIDSTLDLLLPLVRDIVKTSLENEMLGTVLNAVVDPLLKATGTGLGEVDVVVESVVRICYGTVSGYVYDDVNHNAIREESEAGTAAVLYAKLISNADPAQAQQVVAVDPATGFYQVDNVSQGSYTIFIDDNNDPADLTPARPAGWTGTQIPDQERTSIEVTDRNITDINFGLYHGGTVTGISFVDNGSGGGIAHNGVRDGGEEAIYQSVILAAKSNGLTEIDRTTTDGSGRFTLWIPYTSDGSQLLIKEQASGAYLSVSGSAGSTGATYDLTNDQFSILFTSGTEKTGLAFGNTKVPVFSPDGQQHAAAGSVVFYRHIFKAQTEGTVQFSGSTASNAAGWSYALYHDIDCNDRIDATDPILEQAFVTDDQELCLIVKVFIPAQAVSGESYGLSVFANFNPQGTSVYHSTKVSDLTIVGMEEGLRLEKTADKLTALPGETVTYTLTFENIGSEPIHDITIQDVTPAYTLFIDTDCEMLAAGLKCTVESPGQLQSGSITWTINGELLPGSIGTIRFSVKIIE